VCGHEHPRPAGLADATGKRRGLAKRRRGVVQRAVGHRQSREFDNHRLVLEQCLQKALRDFGLVLGVGGQKLLSVGQVINQRGDVVVVVTPTQKLDEVVVAAEQCLELAPDRVLARRLDTKLVVELHGVGNIEQVALALGTDGIEHRPCLCRRVGGVRTAGVAVVHTTGACAGYPMVSVLPAGVARRSQ
jgi:hypothetical protein